jgi:folate-binding protein YgfZ
VLRLSDWGVILATGEDAASFLHGQLTQDMSTLGVGHARPAGYCSAKGRLLATFVAWRVSSDTIALACSVDLLPATLKRLSMFVLRAKCRLADGSQNMALYGMAGGPAADTAPWQLLTEGARQTIRLPDVDGVPRWLVAQPADLPPPDLPALPLSVWNSLEIRSGVPRVTAATADHFVPQMVNLELTGGVNFQKGCYPGQEVVARSQYRGTLKRRLALMEADGELYAGQEVFHDSDPGQPAGEVVLAVPPSVPTGPGSQSPAPHALALVSLKVDLLQAQGRWYAGDTSLHARALPYDVPAQPA